MGANLGNRERGGCLTLFLVLYAIGSVITVITAFSLSGANAALAAQGLPTYPSWYGIGSIVITLIGLAGVYGAWTWKKWGVYLITVDHDFVTKNRAGCCRSCPSGAR